MTELATALIKRISTNLIRARQYEQEDDSTSELQHLLWASQDTARLLLQWNDGKSEIDDHFATTYAESGNHTAERIRVLVAARVER